MQQRSSKAFSTAVSRRSVLRGALAGAITVPLIGRGAFAAPAIQTGKVAGNVTMWVYPLAGADLNENKKKWDAVVSDFQGKNPDVKVKVEVLPWTNRNEKLTTAIAAGAGPDVCYLNDDFIPQHAGDGNLVDLDDLLAADKSDFLENAVANMSYDGKVYGAPILMTITTMAYNTKLFEKAGVKDYPATWDEMLAAGPAFRDAGLYLTSYVGALTQTLNLNYYPLLWQAGGKVLSDDGTKAAFNSPEGLDALNFVVKLFDEKFVDKSEGVTAPEPDRGSLITGKAAVSMTTDSATVQQLEKTLGEGAFKVAGPLKNKVQTSYGTTAGFSVFKHAKDQDAAKAWVQYLTSPETMKTILGFGGYFSPRPSLGSLYANDPILGAFEQYLPMMHSGVKSKSARQIISSLAPHLQSAFLGKSSAEDALKAGEKDVNQILERAK
jgi:multiple sugar transport system substrate-binding protein